MNPETQGKVEPRLAHPPNLGRTHSCAPKIIPIPILGLMAWSLECRRKTLRGVLKGWVLNSRHPVR